MYELAEHLHMTVGQLVEALDGPAEVTGWKAYFSVRDHESNLKQASSDGSVWIRPPWEVKRDG